jgi:hypothetical protein
VNVIPSRITFIGQPQNENSREYGHIVVLPGARAAFFRNCNFESIKKDTTVDNKAYFTNGSETHLTPVDRYGLTAHELSLLNNEMLRYSNGSGGAITTFSSRT